jgi:4-diphosphocytidyl-2-C-methyl-D-erythritol kinase
MPGLKLYAPSKVNLTLEVLGRRQDGYHEIRSVMQAVTLCDRIDFETTGGISFQSPNPEWDAERSLVKKAAGLMVDECGGTPGAVITIDKKIPLSSGLGGDSSDAAAVLSGLNELWRCGISEERLLMLASELGSDVPFFVRGGTALMQGRGETISGLPPPFPLWFVIVVPEIVLPPAKTASMYSRLTPADYTAGSFTGNLVEALEKGSPIGDAQIFNVFELVAFDLFPELNNVRRDMLAAGAPSVHLAGAGPALFSIHSNHVEADRVRNRLAAARSFIAAAAGREGCG